MKYWRCCFWRFGQVSHKWTKPTKEGVGGCFVSRARRATYCASLVFFRLIFARITYTLATKVGGGTRSGFSASSYHAFVYRTAAGSIGTRFLVILMCRDSRWKGDQKCNGPALDVDIRLACGALSCKPGKIGGLRRPARRGRLTCQRAIATGSAARTVVLIGTLVYYIFPRLSSRPTSRVQSSGSRVQRGRETGRRGTGSGLRPAVAAGGSVGRAARTKIGRRERGSPAERERRAELLQSDMILSHCAR
jgi:hypothetical protein